MAINPKQQKFADEYLIDLNATQAAIRAGYSEATAQMQSSRLLSNVIIQNYIAQRQAEREKRTQVTQDRVLLEIARLAFNDPRKAFDDEGTLLPVKQWPDEVAAAISSIKVTEQRIDEETVTQLKEIKFWDKSKNLDMAGRHLGMFSDKLQLQGDAEKPLVSRVVFEVISGSQGKTD